MIYIGLGSNIGPREENIYKAIRKLNEHPQVKVIKNSALYETEPFGYKQQPAFLNAVIEIETLLEPVALLELCLKIENDIGRVRQTHWGPRIIDIDILLFNEVNSNTDDLVLPHPGLTQRNFVLVPLAEISSNRPIVGNKTAAQLLQETTDTSKVQLYTDINARVLFISAPFGSGHTRAAQAVCTALKELNPSIKTEIANVFDFINPFVGKMIIRVYLKILQWVPGLYGGMYGWGDSSKVALLTRECINRFFAHRMYSYIKKYQPTCIVCTHATPAGLIEYLIKQRMIAIPTMAIITDFVVHRWWVYPLINEYFVANQEMRDYLAQCGIDYNRSYQTGIPVHSAFLQKPDISYLYEDLKLNRGDKTILIMGGGAGVLPMDKILEECDKLGEGVQFIVVTGNNRTMFKKLLALQESLRHTVRVLAYVDYVDKLMQMAHVLISKPGGMTSTECLCRELPMIIFHPIPGQEEANTDYLVEHNLAIRADCVAEVKTVLEDVLEDYNIINQVKENMTKWSKPHSAKIIASHILDKHKDIDQKHEPDII